MTTAERVGLRIQFDNSYARLPERFAVRLSPTPVTAPRLVRMNEPLARKLGIDPSELATQQGVEILAGNRLAEGSEPLAMAYAGHQFGGFVPQLGDGRAILLGEVIDRDGTRHDIQLKGSGPTPFSRQGDGRAALGAQAQVGPWQNVHRRGSDSRQGALLLSAGFTSIAGSLYAVMVGFADPDSTLGILISVKMLIMAALGGAGLLFGPLVGALILVPLEEISNNLLGGQGAGITFVVYGAIIVAIARFLPGGILHRGSAGQVLQQLIVGTTSARTRHDKPLCSRIEPWVLVAKKGTNA